LGVFLPSLATHRRVYELLGLNVNVCSEVDRLVDVEPPLITEIDPSYNGGERVWINFGFRKSEFPLMYRYIYRRFGSDGIKCLVTHYVLDRVESLLYRGFDVDMIRNEVEALIHSYIDECGTHKEEEVFKDAGNFLLQILGELLKRFNDIVQIVRSEVGIKVLPVDIIVNASSDLISLYLRATLISRGYKGRRGFTLNKSIQDKYMQLHNKAKHLLRQRLSEAITRHEITDTQKLLESINSVKRRATEVKTISNIVQAVEEESSRNTDFHKLLEIIKQCVEETIKSLQL
jgi:hypothetical protein